MIIPDIPHTNLSATVRILGLNNYFGIRDFALGVVNLTATKNCEQVNAANECIRCKNGYALNLANSTDPCGTCPDGYYQ